LIYLPEDGDMPITVTLRVVGIQFQKTVTVNATNPKIKDVMEAARGGPEDFNYITAPDGSLFQASARIVDPAFKSRSSNRPFPKGLYILADGVAGTNSVTTWQWYQVRKGVQLNQPNRKVEKFTTDSPTIEDGDEIIWRLVVVAVAPAIPDDGPSSTFETKKIRAIR
jgi:hypothetical protein